MIENILGAILGTFIIFLFGGALWIGHQVDLINNDRNEKTEQRLVKLEKFMNITLEKQP
jgi:hypothetical protein